MTNIKRLIAGTTEQLRSIIDLVEQDKIAADSLTGLLGSADHPTLKVVRLELRRRRLLQALLPAIEQLAAQGIEIVVAGLDQGVFRQGADGFVEVEVVINTENPEEVKQAKSALREIADRTECFLIYGQGDYPAKRDPMEEKKFQASCRSLADLQAMAAAASQ